MSKEKSKQVVIIGGSYAGILALKTLLKSSPIELNITLISPNDSGYFNAAAPRLLIEPESIEKTIFPIKPTIEKLTSGTIHTAKFLQGVVTKVDLTNQKVFVDNESEIDYDNLIIASGARAKSPAFKLTNNNDQNYTIKAILELGDEIKAANNIAVIGGGSTGVETSAEIAFKYSDKNVVLYTGASRPLPSFPKSTSSKATGKLNQLGIEIVNGERVNVKDKTIEFADGSTKSFDLIIETLGLLPNTDFLPKKVLNEYGYVETDEYLRLKDHHNVICLGDVVALGANSIVDLVYTQKPVFEKTVEFEVVDNEATQLKAYQKASGITTFIPIGRNGGVGLLFGYCAPSFLIWFAKARDFMISKAGEHFT